MTRIGKVKLKLNNPEQLLHAKVFQFVTENGERSLAEFCYARTVYDSQLLPGGIVRVAVEYRRTDSFPYGGKAEPLVWQLG